MVCILCKNEIPTDLTEQFPDIHVVCLYSEDAETVPEESFDPNNYVIIDNGLGADYRYVIKSKQVFIDVGDNSVEVYPVITTLLSVLRSKGVCRTVLVGEFHGDELTLMETVGITVNPVIGYFKCSSMQSIDTYEIKELLEEYNENGID